MPSMRIEVCNMFGQILQKAFHRQLGFTIVTKAAQNSAQGCQKAVFDDLIESLSMHNDKLALEALTLINLLIFTAPSKKKRSQFLARLENLGLYEELHKVGSASESGMLYDPIVKQLKLFQQNTGQVLGGMQFENEIHKERCRLLEKQNEHLEQKMQFYEEQQKLFDFLRSDLRRFKTAYETALESETIYSPLTPTHRIEEAQLNAFAKNDSGIVDLREVMKGYNLPFKKALEDRLKEQSKELLESRKSE